MNKIAIVTRSMFGGGAERVIAELIKYFDSINIECWLITIDDEEVFYQLPKSTVLIPIGKKSTNKIIDRILRYIKVRQILKKNKIDIVLSMPEDIGIYVIAALLGTRIPIVVSERNNPWVMPDKMITRLLRVIMYKFANGLIFQTEMAMSFFSSSIQQKGIVLQNPLDIRRIPSAFKGNRRKEIVAVGRLTQQKNFKLLIEAFSEFYKNNSDYRLIIYGEGKLRDELENLSQKLLPEGKCLLPGKSKEVLKKINDASMFVLSSDYEGMPNVLIEAMAMGMPVISTDCPSGGPKSLIIDGENGILVPVGDKKSLVNAMEKLKNESYGQLLGNNALNLRDRLGSYMIYQEWFAYLSKIAKKYRR